MLHQAGTRLEEVKNKQIKKAKSIHYTKGGGAYIGREYSIYRSFINFYKIKSFFNKFKK